MKTLHLSIIIVILSIIILINTNSAFAAELGQLYIPPASLGNRTANLFIDITPSDVEKSVKYIHLRLFDPSNNQTFQHVTFLLNFTKQNQILLRDTFHSHSGLLTIKLISNDTVGNWTVFGEREPVLGSWIPKDDKLEINSSLQKGLYHLEITIVTIDNDKNIFTLQDAPKFDSWWTVDDNGNIFRNSKSIPEFPMTNSINTTYTKKIPLWTYDPPSYPGPIAISSNGSFVAVGTRQDDKQGSVYFLNNNGIVIWNHLLSGFVKSVSISPDGKFLEARVVQLLNNGGTDFGYNEWEANPDIYIFDNMGQVIFHNLNLLPTTQLFSLSHDQSFFVTGNNGGIFYSDIAGKLLWKYNTTSTVSSVSISPDGSFASMCTDTGLFYFDRQGLLLWHYQTNSSTLCTNVISSDLGYVLAGDALSNNIGDLYIFDNTGALLWKHTDVSTYLSTSQNMSSDGQYQVEVTGQSNRGYGLTVSYDKIEYTSAVPEFSFAIPVLLISITSLIVFYRINLRK